jgi:hypothetical protein
MMFRGTYTGEFYRALHDALHAEVDLWNIARPSDEMHETKVEALWEEVMHLEKTCRSTNPTVLNPNALTDLVQLRAIPSSDAHPSPSPSQPGGSCD